ncbi:hypothetical protein ACIPSE_28295 [Streptomyces sp. NPDC090106]|uniref:hypothetical protein n=1 Tax=Streptomyces sp. NPDC090106 TaxID=3365946 RepID=UPI0038097E8C
MSEDLVKVYVRQWLSSNEERLDAYDKAMADLAAEGKTVVAMGQIGFHGDDGKADWEVREQRTGRLLASCHDTYDGFTAVMAEADPDGRWVSVDRLRKPPVAPEPIPGLPESLCEVLVEWLESHADPDELADWLDEPVEAMERRMRG